MTDPRSGRRGATRTHAMTRHGRQRTPSPWATFLRFIALAAAVVVASSATVAGVTAASFDAKIQTVHLVGEQNAPPPAIGAYPGGYNLLIVGSDTRKDQGGIGGIDSSVLNDVTILLHVSEDHTSAVAVSIPRDLVVPIPSCPNGKGGSYSSMAGQPMNVTLTYGGLPCTVLTVEKLTGLTIQFAGLITFTGVIEMSNAVGGVNVCVSGPINDPYTGLVIPKAGTVNLQGSQALAFLRSRHGVGDGSDLGRISSQQVYLSSLVRTLKSNDTLSSFPKLFAIASAAASNVTLSSSLKSVDTMVAVAQSLKDIPLDRIVFVQYPGITGVGGIYAGKVAPVAAKASALFAYIKADKPFTLADTSNIGSEADPDAPTPAATPVGVSTPGATPAATPAATPTGGATSDSDAVGVLSGVSGQSAADHTCSIAKK